MVELRDGMLGGNRGSRASVVFVRGFEEREKRNADRCVAQTMVNGSTLLLFSYQMSGVSNGHPGDQELRLRRT